MINIICNFSATYGVELPEFKQYATGIIYLDRKTHLETEKDFDTLAARLGLKVFYWRDVPIDSNAIGTVGRRSEPLSRQVFITYFEEMEKEAFRKQVIIEPTTTPTLHHFSRFEFYRRHLHKKSSRKQIRNCLK